MVRSAHPTWLCNAHILRELRYFEEATGGHHWPIQLREILLEGKRAVAKAKAEGLAEVAQDTVNDLFRRYDYDQWVVLGLMVFPEQAAEPGHKGPPKQTPATICSSAYATTKPKCGDF